MNCGRGPYSPPTKNTQGVDIMKAQEWCTIPVPSKFPLQ